MERTASGEDYEDAGALDDVDLLVTYTCELRPSVDEQLAVRDWVRRGGQWFALHATNTAFDVVVNRSGSTQAVPRLHQVMAETLGSHFLAHPPMGPIQVEVTSPEHPLVQGIAPFVTTYELFLSEYHDQVETLLYARFSGEALAGFPHSHWPDEREHPVMYLRRLGSGCVWYLTLGHCRSDDDEPVGVGELPQLPGSWASGEFHELLRRGIAWGLSS